MISVILNVYRRPHNLKKQLDIILSQSIQVKPENIHVWYNDAGVIQNYPEDSSIKTYTSSWNTKFWGRFTAALMCRTEYVAVIDDDIFCEKDWFKNCLDTISNPATRGILGGSGIILPETGYTRHHTKVGWNGLRLDSAQEVDLVGHAWFFRQEWAKYLWQESPATWDNGEDIMFSYLAQKYGGIKTFVPPHPSGNRALWSAAYSASRDAGSDAAATSLGGGHIKQRDVCVEHCKRRGWSILRSRCPDIDSVLRKLSEKGEHV